MTHFPPFDQAQFIADLNRLIGFKTVVHHYRHEFYQAYRWVKAFFDSERTDFVEFEYSGYRSLLIKPKGSLKPRLLGDGHIDVVPGEDEQFDLREVDGSLFGRGVADMKTQCLMMMTVLRDMIATGQHNDFWLLLTEDEEAGGANGVARVVHDLEARDWWPQWIFAPDGGPNFAYVEKEKGVVTFSAIMAGKAAHASRPYLGENAIERMQRFYQSLQGHLPNPTGPQDWDCSLNMTAISAGTASNQIPSVCRASFDLRFTEQYHLGEVLHQIEQLADPFQAEINIDRTAVATYYPHTEPIAQQYLALLAQVSGQKPRIIHSNGASNGNFYVDKRPDSHILMSNPTVSGSHAPHEQIEIASLAPFFRLVWGTAQL